MSRTSVIFLMFLLTAQLTFADTAKPVFENEVLRVSLTARSPNQIAAFYEARGFSAAMVNEAKRHCFITVSIKNKSDKIFWLELSNWRFTTSSGEIVRVHRNDWRTKWQQMQIPLAHQSTFRWTLLPERLDFRPGEGEGGNITLPAISAPIRLDAQFVFENAPAKKPVEVRIDNILCAKD